MKTIYFSFSYFNIFLSKQAITLHGIIDHFTVVCLVAWALNESKAGVDLVLIETSLLFLC